MNPLILCLQFFLFVLLNVQNQPNNNHAQETFYYHIIQNDFINESGKIILERFPVPPGFCRSKADTNSFAYYLRTLPLKPHGSKVRYHNNSVKEGKGIYCAVVDMEIGNKDLQQCADAVIRLRAEYLYKRNKFDQIHFKFTNGENAEFIKYAEGFRPTIENEKVTWSKQANRNYSHQTLINYLELVFIYAGSYSLSKELISVTHPEQIEIGDVFIKGGFPGHAVIVVDVIVNETTGEKKLLIAQSYMPAQDIQVLINPQNNSPWFELKPNKDLVTPEWVFHNNQLKRFREENE
jgi:hypothetical protein